MVCRVCSGPLSLFWWFRSIVCLHASIRQRRGGGLLDGAPIHDYDCVFWGGRARSGVPDGPS